jgi:hypothetical protein
MKNLLISIFTILVCLNCYSQEKKNYKPLVKELNKMLKEAEEFSWMYDHGFEIVERYKVHNDTLSVTIRGLEDDKPVTHKYEAALADIKDFVHDIYFVISFHNKSVKISELQQNKWVVVDYRSLMHLGKAKDDESEGWARRISYELNMLYTLENKYNYWD